jgi:hypothetical protein
MSVPEAGEKRFSEMTLIEKLRNNLQPKGSLQVVGLHLNDRFFDAAFINECIADLETLQIRAELGDRATSLEKLAAALLMDSAYIEPSRQAADF